MNRKPIALILAFSLILTGFSIVPARATNNDIGRLAMGTFALMFFGSMLNNANRPKAIPSKKIHTPRPEVSRGRQTIRRFTPIHKPPVHQSRGHYNNGHKSKPRHTKINKKLPGSCFFNLRTPYGPRGVYGKKCLDDSMRHASQLPISCHDNVAIRHGQRSQVFGARCLRNHGYRTSSNNRSANKPHFAGNHRSANGHRSAGNQRPHR